MQTLDHQIISSSLADIHAGVGGAEGDLFNLYSPVLASIARRIPASDTEEAESIVNSAFVEAIRELNPPPAENADRILYRRIRQRAHDEALEDRSVSVPAGTMKVYLAILARHGGDFHAAYEAARSGSETLSGATFLAAHVANYSNTDRESIYGGPTSDDEPSVFHAVAEDDIDALDTHDLVHGHLLPLCDEEAHEDVVVRLAYGFPQVSDRVVKLLEDSGFQPGDVLSDVEVSEVLHISGLGSRTVGKRRRAALAKMRAYLAEDEARETEEVN